jgi:hypothetical protein
MRLIRLVSILPFAFGMFAACGGGDDNPQLLDATGVPDSTPVPPDAGPPDACGATFCEADNVCVDLTTDSEHCGNCETACTGGTYCDVTCVCPEPFVPAAPTLAFSQSQAQGGATAWFGVYGDPNAQGVLDVLITAYPTTTTVAGDAYPLTGDPIGVPPFLAAGYDVNIQSPTAKAAVYATAGTITYDTICDGGISGHADNVHFSAVDSLNNPVLVEGGCSFDVLRIDFQFGTACPAAN